jgi:hypothetical protein
MLDSTRDKSLLTRENSLEHLYTIKDFPVFIGNTREPIENDLFFDMVLDICSDTGLIQLRNLIKPEIIYSKYHSEAIGTVWDNHHKEFSKMVFDTINNLSNINIFEIGGSNGKLAKLTLDLDTDKSINSWNIIEPNILDDNILDSRIKFMNDFFNKDFIINNNNLECIVHSHTLEHMYDTEIFINNISESLVLGGYNIFSVPNLNEYLKNKFINTLNFEHTLFLTEEVIDYLLNKNDLEIINKHYYTNHSIFYITRKVDKMEKYEIKNRYKENKDLYLSCISYYKDFVNDINEKINSFDGDIYLFGAHVFSQFLIKLGLNTERIKFILDNSSMKHDTRLYGSDMIIKNPGLITISDNSAIILKVGQYRDEIINGLMGINNKIIFWE